MMPGIGAFDATLHKTHEWLRRVLGMQHPLPVWHDPRYRLAMASIASHTGIEPRRADLVAAYLLDRHVVSGKDIHRPEPASYEAIGRVHTAQWLEAMQDPAVLARVFAVDAADVHVEEALLTTRLACGGTLAAARSARETFAPTMNLLGGFHHARPDRGASLCPLNDIAIAIADLRATGMTGMVAILDLDAHPPDGTAACLAGQDEVWIGSISGADWGALPGVDETVLPLGTGDTEYLAALSQLLGRMPKPELAFVIAGGDVLAGDELGMLGMSLEGVLRRDEMVADALAGVGSVWLPGGGYHEDAWRLQAGTALVLTGDGTQPVSESYDAIHASFARVASELGPADLSDIEITMDDVHADLGMAPPRQRLFLGFYTANGLELALERYGILAHLRRLGYQRLAVEIAPRGRWARLWGHHGAERCLLVELSAERKVVGDEQVLYVHGLTMRDAARCLDKAPLPGQEHPGLGLSREFGELLLRIADRLDLAGVAFAPAWYHTAFFARDRAEFADAARQGRFEALVRAFGSASVRDASTAVTEGRVRMNGKVYTWEPDIMVTWLDGRSHEPDAVAAERDRVRFEIGMS